MPLLDPKIDIVFKLLLSQHPTLLRSVLECVLDLPTPIRAITVLNPDLERDFASDKGAVLDLRIELADTVLIDLEMQVQAHAALTKRILYYWARNYSGESMAGESHDKLRPAISIVWLGERLLAGNRFHSVFRVREEHDHELFCADLELHLFELSKLDVGAHTDDRASKWGKFFRFESESDLEQLAAEDPIMAEAKDALEHISEDPKVASIARERELAALTYRLVLGTTRDLALKEAREIALRESILDLAEAYGIAVDDTRKRALEAMSLPYLEALRDKIKSERRW